MLKQQSREGYRMTENALGGMFFTFYSVVCFALSFFGLRHRGPKLCAFVLGALSIPLSIYFWSNVGVQ